MLADKDNGNDKLQSLVIKHLSSWFYGEDQEGCRASLLKLIARQSGLKLFVSFYNEFDAEFEETIRSAIISPECRIVMTRDEYIAFEAE